MKQIRETITELLYAAETGSGSKEVFALLKENNIAGGTTAIDYDVFCNMAMTLLKDIATDQEFEDALDDMELEGFVFVSDGLVSFKKTAVTEYAIAKELAERIRPYSNDIENKWPNLPEEENKKLLSEVIAKAESLAGAKLTGEQRNAVYSAMSYNLSILTGGPGTGKTSVQRVILKTTELMSSELGIQQRVVLIAPTGQAASRMQTEEHFATTIHKALGIKDESLKTTKFIDAELVIIDEASMVDMMLFEKLIKKIKESCRILIVGDTEQLPSIGKGQVLSDLIDSKVIPTTNLTTIFRQEGDSPIIINASRIRRGEDTVYTDSDFRFVEASSKEIPKLVSKEYAELVNKYGMDEVMCLSAYRRKTSTGVNSLNDELRKAVKGNTTGNYIETDSGKIYVGDKVMYLKNANGLVNGDIGTIESIGEESICCSFIYHGTVCLELEGIEHSLAPAYAQSVHKSQGSEAKAVIFVVDQRHKNMLKRNLIYTGITRAKIEIVIIGSKEAYKEAIREVDSLRRTSRLSRLITHFYQKEQSLAA